MPHSVSFGAKPPAVVSASKQISTRPNGELCGCRANLASEEPTAAGSQDPRRAAVRNAACLHSHSAETQTPVTRRTPVGIGALHQRWELNWDAGFTLSGFGVGEGGWGRRGFFPLVLRRGHLSGED